jgi:hypothetical protein
MKKKSTIKISNREDEKAKKIKITNIEDEKIASKSKEQKIKKEMTIMLTYGTMTNRKGDQNQQ